MSNSIEDKVCNQIQNRKEEGYVKYGVTLDDRKDLSLLDWLNHLQEELLDAALYVEKIKHSIN